MTTVSAISRTHSIKYVADNILKSLKDIIRLSGLDPQKFVEDWEVYLRGITTWMTSGHLRQVELEIINPVNNTLVTRWDLEITYGWSDGDGSFWTDTDQLRYAILKAGIAPSEARYRLLLTRSLGYPEVLGWTSTTGYSTVGMAQQSLGTTIEHHGMGASASYWRKVG